ncbi:MAG: hypothetical protein IKD00_07825 [Candidatus Methanomethylophilaceae archaeon]|nr:hypothetical protein [Candidatus Methanomethylophilaceae archaeon]
MSETPPVHFDPESMKTHTPETGINVGIALATLHKRIVVGMDLMKSSHMMRDAIVSGMLSQGADVIDIGVASAPVVADAAHLGDCAVFVSGSEHYNDISGYVIFDRDGSPYTAKDLRAMETSVNNRPLATSNVGMIHRHLNATDEYMRRVITENRPAPGCSMVVDCRCGVCSDTVPSALNALGVEVLSINGHKDPEFIPKDVGMSDHEFDDMERMVGDASGYIGIRMNPSGSNMTLLDENGSVVNAWKTMALLVAYLKPGKLILPLDVSTVVEDVFNGKLSIPVNTDHAPSDDEPTLTIMGMASSSVCDEFTRQDADLAICRAGMVFRGLNAPDGLRAAIAISHMSCENSIHRLAEAIPDMQRDMKRIHIDCSPDVIARNLNASMPLIESERYTCQDGWRVDLKEGWFLILPPVNGEVELIAEAPDKAYLVGLMEIGEDLIRDCSTD